MSEIIYPDIKVGETSDSIVMKSNTGYYVGTYYREEFGLVPNSRDSDYFATHAEAQSYLNYISGR